MKFYDPVDEFTFQYLNEYKKKLVNIGKGDFKHPEDNEEQRKKQKSLKKGFQSLTDWWSQLLSQNVDSVVILKRLIDNPIIVVSLGSVDTANMERTSKAQAYISKVAIRINLARRLLKQIQIIQLFKNYQKREIDDPDQETEEIAKVLYEAALVNSEIILYLILKVCQQTLQIIQLSLRY